MPAGAVRDQLVGQLLGDFGGEEAGVRVGEAVDLRVHRRQHVRMAVAEAGHRGAAGGVEILLAGGVDDRAAVAGDGHRRRALQVAVEDVGHGRSGWGRDAFQFTPAGCADATVARSVASPAPRRTRRPRAWLDHPTRPARGRRFRRSSPMARSHCRADATFDANCRCPMATPQRGMRDAAVRGRVGWSSQRAAVAGVTRGPGPSPRRGHPGPHGRWRTRPRCRARLSAARTRAPAARPA